MGPSRNHGIKRGPRDTRNIITTRRRNGLSFRSLEEGAGDAPLLGAIRAGATDGVVGVTLSGSGPSVVVWAAHDRAAGVVAQLRETLSDDTRVLMLRVAQRGARLA